MLIEAKTGWGSSGLNPHSLTKNKKISKTLFHIFAQKIPVHELSSTSREFAVPSSDLDFGIRNLYSFFNFFRFRLNSFLVE